jgi:light-regulated signal transduction histidine kinase (bacteriophytochrome)
VGEATRLRQVFEHVLDDAIADGGDGPPRMEVPAEPAGSTWLRSVRDRGFGIDAEYQGRVFEGFEGLHSGAEHAGTGIGLALCRGIGERHGGEIRIDSQPGDWTTGSFALPRISDDERPATRG